jgi:hypothetical protein
MEEYTAAHSASPPRDGDTGPQTERGFLWEGGDHRIVCTHHAPLFIFLLPLTNQFCSRVDSACVQVDRVARDPQCQRRRSRSVGQDGAVTEFPVMRNSRRSRLRLTTSSRTWGLQRGLLPNLQPSGALSPVVKRTRSIIFTPDLNLVLLFFLIGTHSLPTHCIFIIGREHFG